MQGERMSKTKSAELKEFELRKTKAEAEQAESDAAMKRLELKAAKLSHKKVTDGEAWRRGQFLLNGVIDRVSCQDLSLTLERFHRVYPGHPITITIQSEGGSVLDGWGLFDTIRTMSSQGHQITTRVRGYAASMGAVIFQAGDLRVMGRESHLMFHEISSVAWGKLHEIQDQAKFAERLNKRVFNLIAERANASGDHEHTGQALYSWAKAKDRWVDANTCVERGFADAIG